MPGPNGIKCSRDYRGAKRDREALTRKETTYFSSAFNTFASLAPASAICFFINAREELRYFDVSENGPAPEPTGGR